MKMSFKETERLIKEDKDARRFYNNVKKNLDTMKFSLKNIQVIDKSGTYLLDK